MRLNFRQGIIRALLVTGQPSYLQHNVVDNAINITILAERLMVTAAYKTNNYVHEHRETVIGWGPLVWNANWGAQPSDWVYYLYWDWDIATGQVTRSFTPWQPTFGPTQPVHPAIDQHWFDTAEVVMKVWDGLVWEPTIRVFAGSYTSAGGVVITHYPLGSQVGLISEVEAGWVIYGMDMKAILTSSGEFFTSVTPGNTYHGNFTSPVKLELLSSQAIAAEPIPAYSAVSNLGESHLILASDNDIDRRPIGIVLYDMLPGESNEVITNGIVYNDQWDWDYTLGKDLFCGSNGELLQGFPAEEITRLKVASILDRHNILVDIGNFGGGMSLTGPSGPAGASGYSGVGISGYSGIPGTASASGYSGATGGAGASGYSGATGGAGASGYSGATGGAGASGYSGAASASGYSGAASASGYSGLTGSQGLSGYSGAAGDAGASLVFSNTVHLTTRQIMNLKLTPQVLVPAPGVGKTIMPVEIVAHAIFNTKRFFGILPPTGPLVYWGQTVTGTNNGTGDPGDPGYPNEPYIMSSDGFVTDLAYLLVDQKANGQPEVSEDTLAVFKLTTFYAGEIGYATSGSSYRIPRSLVENKPLIIATSRYGDPFRSDGTEVGGIQMIEIIDAPFNGAGYAIGDTGTVNSTAYGNNDATYIVTAVDGTGGVLAVDVTYGGTGYQDENDAPLLIPGGAQPGAGDGGCITTVWVLGTIDAELKVTTYYTIFDYSGSGIGGVGTSGYSGFSGSSGVQGAPGVPGGTSGYSGAQGTSGYSGAGSQGASGYSGTSGPYIIGCTFNDRITANTVLVRHPFPVSVTFPTSLTDSQGQVDTVPTAQTDFDIRKSTDDGATSSSIGTMSFALGSRFATFIFASPVSFAMGDVLTVVAPSPSDVTFAGLGFSLLGAR